MRRMRAGGTGGGVVALVAGALLVAGAAAGGCAGTRIELAEKLGYAKREQLVDKVEAARDGQEAAKKQFESALAEFIAVTGAKGGDLEGRYDRLRRQQERSAAEAEKVRGRVAEVDRVAQALFGEWERELGQYDNASMRRASERQLGETRGRYDRLIGAMRAAEGKMTPVLAAFKDQVLFLKHNLNARAIASLQESVAEVQADVARLVAEMQASIDEANAFIEQMGEAG